MAIDKNLVETLASWQALLPLSDYIIIEDGIVIENGWDTRQRLGVVQNMLFKITHNKQIER